MDIEIKNIFQDIPNSNLEIFEDLLKNENFRLERIISTGQSTSAGEWYDQEKDEWVILLSGSATLLFEGETLPKNLKTGDYVLIPAHTRHRVESTSNNEVSVWLALHFKN
jgi:cupin 2 domain-containing protein